MSTVGIPWEMYLGCHHRSPTSPKRDDRHGSRPFFSERWLGVELCGKFCHHEWIDININNMQKDTKKEMDGKFAVWTLKSMLCWILTLPQSQGEHLHWSLEIQRSLACRIFWISFLSKICALWMKFMMSLIFFSLNYCDDVSWSNLDLDLDHKVSQISLEKTISKEHVVYTPENERMSPKKGPCSNESSLPTIIFPGTC